MRYTFQQPYSILLYLSWCMPPFWVSKWDGYTLRSENYQGIVDNTSTPTWDPASFGTGFRPMFTRTRRFILLPNEKTIIHSPCFSLCTSGFIDGKSSAHLWTGQLHTYLNLNNLPLLSPLQRVFWVRQIRQRYVRVKIMLQQSKKGKLMGIWNSIQTLLFLKQYPVCLDWQARTIGKIYDAKDKNKGELGRYGYLNIGIGEGFFYILVCS